MLRASSLLSRCTPTLLSRATTRFTPSVLKFENRPFSLLSNILPTASTTTTTTTSTIQNNFKNNAKLINQTCFTQKREFSIDLAAPQSRLKLSESFIDGTSAVYVEQMYEAWKNNPSSVHVSWASYFQNIERGVGAGEAYMSPPTLYTGATPQAAPKTEISGSKDEITEILKLTNLILAYQVRGHVLTNLDPLGLDKRPVPPELQISSYGWTEADLNKEFPVFAFKGRPFEGKEKMKLGDIVNELKQAYCGNIGIEYMHIQAKKEIDWIKDRFENRHQRYPLSKDDKINLYNRLLWADTFEKFLQKKFHTHKRFGLDGCEALIPGFKTMIDHIAELGVESIVIGMPHRGRLNVLANVLRKPLPSLFAHFDHNTKSEDTTGAFSGDVKYHLGTSYDRSTRFGKKVHLSLLPNPSHLEAVNPVVLGKARAKQYYLKDEDRSKVVAVLLHGDAAFSGQGVVYETFDLAALTNYTTGGTIHIIVNNQIGFTTDPRASRSSDYCTDVAKSIGAPIIHVNGDDPEDIDSAFRFAAEWRQTFKKDVVLDIVCYRRFGHNELDEPRLTQPVMYLHIDKQLSTLEIYQKQLLSQGIITPEITKSMKAEIEKFLNEGFAAGATHKVSDSDWLASKWDGFKSPSQLARIKDTGVPMELLKSVGEKMTTVPAGFTLHRNVQNILQNRKKMLETGKGIDWGTAEALAFGTLLAEGNHVRVSGQDVERGTFSHRHAVLHDQKTGEKYCPLAASYPNLFDICNSSLSEFAVLGFEFGYALENPNALVIWEAQFGDFANGAQVIIDQFISGAEAKWKNMCGLVLLLPHGYEGQGPEHSSARLERFLQLCDSNPFHHQSSQDPNRELKDTNLQVVNLTTPANYFHVLRRQIHRDFRKPLVVMSPKSLLKFRKCVSTIEDFDDKDEHVRFLPLIGETNHSLVEPNKIRKVVFCSGKVYYDLQGERDEKLNIKDVAIVRLEQLVPFPFDDVAAQIKKYPNAELIWCQEEPMNQGAFNYVYQHIRTAAKPTKGVTEVRYVGREPSASTATGFIGDHLAQQHALVLEALK